LTIVASDEKKERREATNLKKLSQVRLLVSVKLQDPNVAFTSRIIVTAAGGHFARNLIPTVADEN